MLLYDELVHLCVSFPIIMLTPLKAPKKSGGRQKDINVLSGLKLLGFLETVVGEKRIKMPYIFLLFFFNCLN